MNIINSIIEARKHGDLSENAEYDAAKEKQGLIEAKILELENKVMRAKVINISEIQSSKIRYGASVELLNKKNNSIIKYKIVSEYEADISKGFISIISPLAKTLIGKENNEIFELKSPGGIKRYKILSVNFV